VSISISRWWSGWSSKFCGLLIHQRSGDRAVGSGGFLSYACYCLSLPRGWCVAYVGGASVYELISSADRNYRERERGREREGWNKQPARKSEAHGVLTTAILLPQRLSCRPGKIVSLRMLTDLRLADSRLTTAQQQLFYANRNFITLLNRLRYFIYAITN
jgi:hypothetical protein